MVRHGSTLLVCAVAAAAVAAAPPASAAPRCGGRAQADAVGRPGERVAWRAELVHRTRVRARPGRGAAETVAPADAAALLVLAAARDANGHCHVRVRLPSRPNRAAGWVDARRVVLRPTPWSVEVRRRTRQVTLLHAGRAVGRWSAVVGAPSTPTPRGTFALVEAWPSNPNAFLGRWIVTLTAHSDVLQRFEGGDGRVAIHGRGGASLSDPLGSARSHGCVRLANRAIAAIVRRIGVGALPGTPVEIR